MALDNVGLSTSSPSSTTLPDETPNSEENVDQILLAKVRDILEKDNGLNTPHSTESQQRKMYECEICKKQFTSSSNRNSHRKRHDNVKPYECLVCMWKSFTKQDMQRHSLVHIKTDTGFSCPVELCKKKSNNISELKFHLEKFHNISSTNPVSCMKCNKKYTNSRGFCTHFFTEHDHEENSSRAESIQKKESSSSLVTSDQFQEFEKNYQCTSEASDNAKSSEFEKMMNSLQNLQSLPILNFQNVSFPTVQNGTSMTSILNQQQFELKSVIMDSSSSTHSSKVYECDICQKKYAQAATRNRHRKQHSNVKPYECNFCEMKFYRNDERAQHLMLHIKNRVGFECPVVSCDGQFIHFSELQNHLKNHHAVSHDNPASCKTCHQKYTSAKYLVVHFYTGHKNESTSDNPSSLPASNQFQEKDKKEQCSSITSASMESSEFLDQMNQFGGFEAIISRLSHTITSNFLPSLHKTPQDQAQLWSEQISRSVSASLSSRSEQSHSPAAANETSLLLMVNEENSPVSKKEEKQTMECTHCGIAFKSNTMSLLHKSFHTEGDPFKCALCGTQCGDEFMFTTHLAFSDHSTQEMTSA